MEAFDVLIIEDELEIAAGTAEYFNLFEVKTHHVQTPAAALEFLKTNSTRLVLLDVNLGSESGFALCKTMRETMDIPILFVSARTSQEDMLLGLNLGGDDYITKPYSLSVLLAKVKNILKRYSSSPQAQATASRLTICSATNRILLDNQPLDLKNMEHKLLKYLMQNPGRTIDKDELFSNIWGYSFASDGTLNVHIRRLREKIEIDPQNPQFIKTVWGTGYVFTLM